jgi:agmatinase
MYVRTVLPGFSGFPSFLRAGNASVESLEPGQLAVLGLPWCDALHGDLLTSHGPSAIREASAEFVADVEADPNRVLVDIDSGRRFRFRDPLPIVDLGDLPIRIGDAAATTRRIASMANRITARQALAIYLGGGRAISAPLVAACATGLPAGRRLAYIQLTSSLGLGASDGDMDGGATVTTLLAQRAVQAEDVAWLGVNGYVPLPEWGRARDGGGVVLTVDELTAHTAVVTDALKPIVERCDAVYLTLDVSAVDTGYAPGAIDLRVGGLEPSVAIAVVGALSELPLVALDVVGVAPAKDPAGRTARLSFEFVLRALGTRLN